MTAAGITTVLLAVAFVQDDEKAIGPILRKLKERAERSVVAIEVDRTSDPQGRTGSGPHGTHQDYYNRPQGPTTGTVIDKGGYILTSYFNVSGKIRQIRVTVWDGRSYLAELLGFDQSRDIALLRIPREDLPVLPVAEAFRQGDFVAVVGRSPNLTVNLGILSALQRRGGTAVQTDAEMNYGNVGGPLLSLRGELLGVTAHIRPREPWGQSSGVGFATKFSEIRALLPRLKAKGRILEAARPYLGVQLGAGIPNVAGVHVGGVVPGSPAAKAGLRADDIIVEFGGTKVADFAALRALVEKKKIGEKVVLKIKRTVRKKWVDRTVTVELEAIPRGH